MRVLVACEESQRVCMAFRHLGHEAYSCDIEECSGGHPECHIQNDVLPLLNGDCGFQTADGMEHRIVGKWDMLIAFPPCTYMTNAGVVRMRLKGEIDTVSNMARKYEIPYNTLLNISKGKENKKYSYLKIEVVDIEK